MDGGVGVSKLEDRFLGNPTRLTNNLMKGRVRTSFVKILEKDCATGLPPPLAKQEKNSYSNCIEHRKSSQVFLHGEQTFTLGIYINNEYLGQTLW